MPTAVSAMPCSVPSARKASGFISSRFARSRTAGNRTNSSTTLASEHDRLSKRRSKSLSSRAGVPPQNQLGQIPLLNILSGQDRQRVLHELTEARYGKGEFIFREGDPTEYFHIVKEGTVKCVKSNPDGKECTLKVLMPGDLFCCDASAFDGASHPGTAQPMGDVSVLRMKKEAYFKMLRGNPDAAMEVIRYLGNRLNEAQEKAKVLALDRADQRLASLLVNLAERSGIQ